MAFRWKDGTLGFKNHEKSATHKEAVEVLITTPSSYSDIGEQLSNVHAEQKIKPISNFVMFAVFVLTGTCPQRRWD